MAEPIIAAAVQPRWKRYSDEGTLRDDLGRFMRLAHDKGADVVLFPELTGLMLVGPLAADKKEPLQKRSGLFGRVFGSLGGEPELADVLPTLITEYAEELIERYIVLFGGLAYEYRMLLVAGSLLAQTPEGSIEYRAGVFDANGTLMGWQSKLHLTEQDGTVAEEGADLTAFEADFGRFGVLIGHDLLFPELAHSLAFRGCVALFHPTLARSRDSWRRQQIVARARAQENQLFLAQSFLVGTNDLFIGEHNDFAGRSAVLAPVELSPRGDGVLGEVGAEKVEGVVAGQWNIPALRDLWESAEVPIRQIARVELFSELYNRLPAYYGDEPSIARPARELTEWEPAQLEALPPTSQAPDLPEPPLDPPVETEPGSDAVTDLEFEAVEEQALNARSVPIIDPDTGYYLGERRVGARDDA
ncbi:MAG: nitrilase-related carbon-nitrogen hydrolase [Ardenticatenaceae bacterium]